MIFLGGQWRTLFPIALLLGALTGCTVAPYNISSVPEIQQCSRLYEALDARVVSAGAQDAGVPRVAGFPFLRSSRFLASFASELSHKPETYQFWLMQLNHRAIDALMRESARFEQRLQPQNLQQRLTSCGQTLVASLVKNKQLTPRVLSAVQVSPDYHYWQRISGLYPITALPFKWGVVRDQLQTRRREERYITRLPQGNYQIYSLNKDSEVLRQAPWPLDNLGAPQPDKNSLAMLFKAFAPAIAVPSTQNYDQVGTVVEVGEGFRVDIKKPSIYIWVDHGRYDGEVTLRLNYAVWFSQRPAESGLDLLSGKFDGWIWRVHLNNQGDVLAWDWVHQCGCWYRLYPAEGYTLQQGRSLYREPIYEGQQLSGAPEKLLYLESGTHHILAIRDRVSQVASRRVELVPYRRLKDLGVSADSVFFNSNGIVESSRRAERFLFWPMGVPSAGAMRVAGTHAIAFVGTRHFDDPFILEASGLRKLEQQEN